MIKSENKRKQAKLIFEMIKAAGGKRIYIDFDGSGDSGSIDSVSIQPDNMDFPVIYDMESSTYKDGKWVVTSEPKKQPVCAALEHICYDMLEQTGIDWYNNDGGFGELVIDLDTGSIKLEVSTRFTEYNTDAFEMNTDLELKD